ncbi:MAG: MFS transporter [Candidatus Binataceae bacterium]
MDQIDNEYSRGVPPARLRDNRAFVRLWIGETVSVFGSRMGSVALSFAAVIALGATPMQMGLLAAVRIAPALAVSLFAGVWVDRLARRPILIGADIARALLLGTIPLAAYAATLRIEHLYAVMFVVAMLDVAFDVAYRSYLPTLVVREQLIDANSKLTASSAVAEVAGFGLAGWLVQWLSAPFAILIDALTFVFSAGAIATIHVEESNAGPRRQRDGVMREILSGARAVAADPRLRAIAVTNATVTFALGTFGAVYMLYVVNSLGLAPGVLGVIFGVGGASALLGALAAGRVTGWLGVGGSMILSVVIEGIAMMLIPIASGAGLFAVTLLVAHQLLGDSAGTIYEINAVSLAQSIAQERMLGRVNATLRFLAQAAALLGALAGGAIGEFAGLRAALIVGAVAIGAAALWLAASPLVRSTAATAVAPKVEST